MATKPMSFGSTTPVLKPATPNMFGATSADSNHNNMGFGSRPMTPTSSSGFHTTTANNHNNSNRTSMSSNNSFTPTAATSSFTIPPLSKPLTSTPLSSSNYSGATASRPPFSQPQQKPAGTPPLSHTLGNLSTSTSAFGGFQSANSNTNTNSGMATGGMGGLQNGFHNSNGGFGMGMGSMNSTLTPVQQRPPMGMGMMTPLQPTSTGLGASKVGGTGGHKGKNSDLGMFDPFS